MSPRRAGHWAYPGPPSTVAKGPLPGPGSPARRPPGHWIAPSASASWTCSPPRASSTAPRARSSPHCSTKAGTCARNAPCTASWPPNSRSENGAISSAIRTTPKPELLATAPNQVWSWDITRLLGPKPWTYFYLYVLLDIFSRYVVGWMVAERENAALAARLIEQSCLKQAIQPQVLTLHSDRGSPMTAKCTAQLLADLGVTRSLGRPQVSDDNPFSEAQFKTLKYHPGFPGRFDDIHAAVAFCRAFFPWYNHEHRHAGIAMLTPSDVHHGRAQRVLEQRQRTLQDAWAHNPERFVHGPPKPQALPKAVWINPPTEAKTSPDAH